MSDALIELAPGNHPDDECILRLRQQWGELSDGPDYDSWIEGKLLQAEDEIELYEGMKSGVQVRIDDLERDRDTLQHLLGGAHVKTTLQAVSIDSLEASVMSLRAIIDAKLHRRKCRTCGHIGYYADGVVPHCLCEKCKSQDTRRMKE